MKSSSFQRASSRNRIAGILISRVAPHHGRRVYHKAGSHIAQPIAMRTKPNTSPSAAEIDRGDGLPSVHRARKARGSRADGHGQRPRLPLGRRAGARVPRCDGGTLVRQRRLRPQRDRRRDRGSGPSTPVLPLVLLDGHELRRLCWRTDCSRWRRCSMSKSVLWKQRLRRQRHPGEAGLVLQQRAGAAGEEEDHRPRSRVPRRHRRGGQSHRAGLACIATSTCRCRRSVTSPRPTASGRLLPGRPRRSSPACWRTNSSS